MVGNIIHGRGKLAGISKFCITTCYYTHKNPRHGSQNEGGKAKNSVYTRVLKDGTY
jgi:hypothetical protein